MWTLNKERFLPLMVFIIITLLEAYSTAETCNSRYFKECPKGATVISGESVSLRCITRKDTDMCLWEYQKDGATKKLNLQYISGNYEASELSKRNCTLTIKKARDADHTEWKCTPFFKGESVSPSTPTVRLIVAKPIKSIYIYNMNSEKKERTITISEDTRNRVVCEAKQARPQPVATWYIRDGGSRIKVGEVEMLPLHRHSKEITNSEDPIDYMGTFDGTIDFRDNKKSLECVVSYPDVGKLNKTVEKILNIEFTPKFTNKTLTVDVDKKKIINLEFLCNPPPDDADVTLSEAGGKTLKPGQKSKSLAFGKISCKDEYCHLPIEIDKEKYQHEDLNLTVSVKGVYHSVTLRSVEQVGTFSKTGLAFAIVGIVIVAAGIIGYVIYKRRELQKEEGYNEPKKEPTTDPEEAEKLKNSIKPRESRSTEV